MATLKIKLLLKHTGISSSIPLDFELLYSAMPYHQSGLRNRLYCEITFNDYGRVIQSTGASPDAKYEILDISLE